MEFSHHILYIKTVSRSNVLIISSSVTLHDSIQEEEAEFDGDPTLELVSDDKLQDEKPAWAKKILSCVQPKGTFKASS